MHMCTQTLSLSYTHTHAHTLLTSCAAIDPSKLPWCLRKKKKEKKIEGWGRRLPAYRERESVSCSVVSDSLQHHGLQPTRLLCPWGFSRQEYWSGLPCPSPGDLSRDRTHISCVFCIAERYFITEPPVKPLLCTRCCYCC